MVGSPLDQKVNPGQQSKPMDKTLNDFFTQVMQIYLVRKEILAYLDGSALINLSSVTRRIRHLVTSSDDYKKRFNLRVNTKNVDFLTTSEGFQFLTNNLVHLTLVCNSELDLVYYDENQNNFSSLLAQTLPHLSTLVLVNDFPQSQNYKNATIFLNKILSLSSNLKSLSIPYDFMLNPITFDNYLWTNLKELKFTTSCYKQMYGKKFEENLNLFACKCINLSSFSCQELTIVKGRYGKTIERMFEFLHYIFKGILTIIENNSEKLEKLEFGISTLMAQPEFSSKLAKISFPNLKILNLRGVQPEINTYLRAHLQGDGQVLEILNNLPKPGNLTHLKLTFSRFPLEMFDLIPEKFAQLKSLSLKASLYHFGPQREICWSFLQKLTGLEELEIIRFKTECVSNFGQEISQNFPDFLQKNNNLSKLSLKGMDFITGSRFFDGIVKMKKLKELRLTGCSLYLDDFLSICKNFRDLEILEISHLHADKFKLQSTFQSTTATVKGEIDYCEILMAFSSLKYLKVLSIEIWSGDFSQILESISFPYLKSLTLCNANLKREELENIIELNSMLKELYIVTLAGCTSDENFQILNERKNCIIYFRTKQVKFKPNNSDEENREDLDPDSKPLSEQYDPRLFCQFR